MAAPSQFPTAHNDDPSGGAATLDAGVRSLSDERLLTLVAAKDSDAFMELYDRFAHRMLGLIVKFVRDRDAANDVLQDVMSEIWDRAANKYDPALGRAEGWLLRLSRSRSIDYLRRTRRTASLDAASEGDVFAAGLPGDDGLVVHLRRGLSQLPDDERVPIMLAYAQGLSRDQIAEHLSMPVGTIKTRIRRGVQRLTEWLGTPTSGAPE